MPSRPSLPLLIAPLLALAACGGASDGPERASPQGTLTADAAGHQRMLDELAEVVAWVMEEDRFLGDAELHRVRAELARGGSARRRVRLHSQVSAHELRLGHTDAALAALDAADAALAEVPADERGGLGAELLFYRGLASMRAAENANCVAHCNADSCLVPISGDGVHEDRAGSRAAVAAFTAFLEHPERDPDEELTARWLLNIAAMTLGAWPDGLPAALAIPREVYDSGVDFPRFPNVSRAAGADTFSLSGGVVAEDLDGDGRLDLLTSTWDYQGPMRLLHNRGDGTFEERTAAAGLEGLTGGLNLVHADVDADGDHDVLVLRGAWFDDLGSHPNSLLLNDGAGRFSDVTFAAGLGERHAPTQAAAFADADGDGDLDLYVGNEDTQRSYFPSQLFVAGDDGRFVDRAAEAGVLNNRYAKSAAWGDADDDGDPDLFVSNLRDANRLYVNDGELGFADRAVEAGVERPEMSFSSWWWDFDNDGDLDLYCAAYVEDTEQVAASWLGREHEHESGRLFRNDGGLRFSDVSEAAGLGRLVTTMGANHGDLDDDGWLDLYLGTGFPSYTALMPNVMYRNVGGERFEDVTAAGGFGHLQKGHGVAFADLDDDGDQDVFEQMGGAYTGDAFRDALYANPGSGRHWLRVELVDARGGRSPLGVAVTAEIVDAGARRTVHRRLPTSGSFGSNPHHLHLGLGAAERVERLTVRWPWGRGEQVWEEVAVDRAVRIREGSDALEELARRPAALPTGG